MVLQHTIMVLFCVTFRNAGLKRRALASAQKCSQLAAARSARHSILCETCCQVMQSAGVPTSLEPNCSRVAGSNPVTSAGDRADILCVLQDRLLLSDVSVTHCYADTFVGQAAANAGSAAEACAAKKVAKYALREPGGYDFTPLVLESYANALQRISS